MMSNEAAAASSPKEGNNGSSEFHAKAWNEKKRFVRECLWWMASGLFVWLQMLNSLDSLRIMTDIMLHLVDLLQDDPKTPSILIMFCAVCLVQIVDRIVGSILENGNKFAIWKKVFYFCTTNTLIFSFITGCVWVLRMYFPFPSDNVMSIINLMLSPTTQQFLNTFFLPENSGCPFLHGFAFWMITAGCVRFVVPVYLGDTFDAVHSYFFPPSEVDADANEQNGAAEDEYFGYFE